MMLKFDEAFEIVINSVQRLNPEVRDILSALDYILAEDIYSDIDIPQFDNSAVDGYAIISSDTYGADRNNPARLKLIEEIPVGRVPKKTVSPGYLSKIMTGSPIPQGADAVIMVENTMQVGDMVEIYSEVRPGDNIRICGEDVKRGELVLKVGDVLTPAAIGMLASLNIGKVNIIRRPVVAFIVTGNELIDIGDKYEIGKVRNVNTYTIFGNIVKSFGIPLDLGRVPDEPKKLLEKVKYGLDNADILVLSAGVSVGEHDIVKDVLKNAGVDIKFWRVAHRPGQPILFGVYEKKPVFGLPGNTVSCMITFEIYVKPTILKLQGKDYKPKKIMASIGENIKKRQGFRYFFRVRLTETEEGYKCFLTGPQGSGILKSMIKCNGLLEIPEDVTIVNKGDIYPVRLLG